MKLARAALEELLADASRRAPDEACGVLLGECGAPSARVPLVEELSSAGALVEELRSAGALAGSLMVKEAIPCRNGTATPGCAFSIGPLEVLAASRRAAALGLELVGFYHSHPGSPAIPSPDDLAAAVCWPGMVHLLAGGPPGAREVRAWLLVNASGEGEAGADAGAGQRFEPCELELIDDP